MNKLNIQEYLSLGYIYLLLLGIATDAIYFGFLGISILDYSAISDVLLSPVKLLARNLIVCIILLVIISSMFLYNKWQATRLKKKGEPDGDQADPTNKLLLAACVMILFFFVGIGIGAGKKNGMLLSKGELKPDHHITFANGESIESKIIGRNSMYLFYVLPNQKQVIITPIEEHVFQLKKLEQK
jgi:hypothetical protein